MITDAIRVAFNGTETFSAYPSRTANKWDINNGLLTVTGRSGGGLLSDFSLQCSTDWECTFKIKISGNSLVTGLISKSATGIESNKRIYFFDGRCSVGGTVTNNVEHDIKLIRKGTSVSVYIDGVLGGTANYDWLSDSFGVYAHSWGGGTHTMRDLIFKPL